MERFLEALATRVKGPEADGKQMTINFVLPDVDESYVLTLENAVLHHQRREPDPDASVTIRVTRELLVRLFGGQVGARELAFSDQLDVDGSRMDLLACLRLLDPPNPTFSIVTP
jgi:alkyl sulfatase BDS1-like metallo-beta-lactamase superfamily hydrolase